MYVLAWQAATLAYPITTYQPNYFVAEDFVRTPLLYHCACFLCLDDSSFLLHVDWCCWWSAHAERHEGENAGVL